MAQYIKTEEGYKKLATFTNDKMDKFDPVGIGSFSMNRKVGTVIGVNSHAEGNNTTASGDSSHAEGSGTTASDYYSHAEGSNTTASGNSSHAEGTKTTASGFCSHAEGSETVANGTDSHAEGYFTTASGYSSHAEGYWATASGDYSHAEGGSTKASGRYSHAEGNGTKASGTDSHAEGGSTTASGYSSHAEGNSTNQFSSVVTTTNPTTNSIITAWKTKKFSVAKGDSSHVEGKDNLALDDYSHAEGYQTTASGTSSHAEGDNTTASKYCSHAEGYQTKASGRLSHAEGNGTTASGDNSHAEGFSTKASGDYSHVQGKYNIEDTSNKYADIIGNGTITARSNAATVDWNGNAWFAGDVYTGSTSGTNKDDGSKKLATEEYVDSSIAAGGADISLGLTSASVGQIIKVKAVDESGKPTEWEAADMASGGGMRWQKIKEITLTEQINSIVIGEDDNGVSVADYNPIAMKVEFLVPADNTQTNNNGAPWLYPSATNMDNGIRAIGSIAAWKTTERRSIEFFIGDIDGIFAGGNVNSQLVLDSSNKPNITVMNGVTLFINGTNDHWPVGTIVSLEVLSGRA